MTYWITSEGRAELLRLEKEAKNSDGMGTYQFAACAAAPALARRVEELEMTLETQALDALLSTMKLDVLANFRERAAKLVGQIEPHDSPRSGYYSFGRAELATAIRALPLEGMKK